jgi:hypothetical protein
LVRAGNAAQIGRVMSYVVGYTNQSIAPQGTTITVTVGVGTDIGSLVRINDTESAAQNALLGWSTTFRQEYSETVAPGLVSSVNGPAIVLPGDHIDVWISDGPSPPATTDCVRVGGLQCVLE